MFSKKAQITLLSDKQWSIIDGELCRVVSFTPLVGYVENGEVRGVDTRTPYASITIECKKIPHRIKGFITHKLDFKNLWHALKERELGNEEEAIIVWSKSSYRLSLLNYLPGFWPKVKITICPKGFWDRLSKEAWDSDLMEFTLSEVEVAHWKPEIIK